ncbi:hypothetical protein L3V59_39305 [Burkholderia aenigmatica]|uniref:hypothetical protein n=1 Tax=Burkholderia aenigmatica TaxID=2015348 RepID=UPI001F3CC456|nr:hypothetical protein [Burkholderia aenigmatica]UKD16736.1 hypothetical protein L3V59_39305 [Burkholderia aenigmatica]
MSIPALFDAMPALRKVEGPYYRNMVDPDTRWPYSTKMVVVAPPDYPQLADGLEIGALYVLDKNLDLAGCLFYLDGSYFESCEKLVALVTDGKRLPEGPYRMVDWSNGLSELVSDKEKYPESDGRGPFWELLRYGLRGMTFGPVACKKLAADFTAWDMKAWAVGDLKFYQWYCFLRECFETANGTGMVVYPALWFETKRGPFWEPKLGQETIDVLEPENRHYDDEDEI